MTRTLTHHTTGAVLWTGEAGTLGQAVSAALRDKANLSGTDLSGAKYSGKTRWPSPAALLLARWGATAQCAALMRYDAENCPGGIKAFSVWAKGGACPYAASAFQRMANFQEDRAQWKARTKLRSALWLAQALLTEQLVEVK